MKKSTLSRASEADLELASRIKRSALEAVKIPDGLVMLEEGSRKAFVVMARRVACVLMREHTRLSMNQIGELVGVSHASAWSAIEVGRGEQQTTDLAAEAWGIVQSTKLKGTS